MWLQPGQDSAYDQFTFDRIAWAIAMTGASAHAETSDQIYERGRKSVVDAKPAETDKGTNAG